MPYVDSDYYKSIYKGSTITDDELDNRLELASDKIDSLTYNRIVGIGFDSLTAFQQEKIKKAVCAQADFMYKYGDYLNFPFQKYVAGSTELDFNSASGGGNTKTDDIVMNYLSQTGLICRRL